MADAKTAKGTGKGKRIERAPGEEILHGKLVHLDPLKSPYWQMEFDLYGTPHRKSTGLKDQRKAERFAKEYREARIDEHVQIYGKRGVPDRLRDGRLDRAVDEFWAREAHKDVDAADTERRFRNIVEILGGATMLSEISDKAVWKLITTLEGRDAYGNPARGKLGDDRVDAHVKTLRRLMNDAVNVRKFRLFDMPNWQALTLGDLARTREFSLEEVDATFDAWRPDTLQAAKFLYESGLRLANSIELKWSEVDLMLNKITIRVKARRSKHRKRRKLDERRSVQELPISPLMREILLGEQGKHPTRVFTFRCRRSNRRRCGTRFVKGRHYPLRVDAFYVHWTEARDAAKLVDARPHDFRRTRGCLILRATGDITKAQKVLHHSRVTTTAEHYAHVAPADTLAAMVRTSEFEAAERARRPRRPVDGAGALPGPVAGSPEVPPKRRRAEGPSPCHSTTNPSTSPIPRSYWMPVNDNYLGAAKNAANDCRNSTIFSSGNAKLASNLDRNFHGNRRKSTVREANSRTFPEVEPSLGVPSAHALETGETVIHQGVRGRFREVRHRFFSGLDDAFQPTPMERLLKAGHRVFAFEPLEGAAPNDGVVVLADRHQVAVRDIAS